MQACDGQADDVREVLASWRDVSRLVVAGAVDFVPQQREDLLRGVTVML